MFARSFRQDHRVGAAEFEVRASSAITIAEHVEDRNTAAEMLSRGRGIVPRHVKHAVETMGVASETKIGRGVGCLLGYELKLATAFVEFTSLQVSFGRNQSRLANRLTISNR